jgi:hypothetical protein
MYTRFPFDGSSGSSGSSGSVDGVVPWRSYAYRVLAGRGCSETKVMYDGRKNPVLRHGLRGIDKSKAQEMCRVSSSRRVEVRVSFASISTTVRQGTRTFGEGGATDWKLPLIPAR